MTYSLCMNRTEGGYENIPEKGCVDTNKAFDKDFLSQALSSTILDVSGVACSCLTSGCNDPRGR